MFPMGYDIWLTAYKPVIEMLHGYQKPGKKNLMSRYLSQQRVFFKNYNLLVCSNPVVIYTF